MATRAPRSEAFRRWFGASKVVHKDGRPRVMYHGGSAAIDEFSLMYVTESGTWGQGFYFSNDEPLARQYAKNVDEHVVSAYLSLQNPFIVDYAMPYDERSDRNRVFRTDRVRERLIEAGYDGVLITQDNYVEAVAFYPTQIKAVDNVGTFAPEDPRIRHNAVTFESLPDGRLVGWRAARYHGGYAVSGADSRQRAKLRRGELTRFTGAGMFLANDRQYVIDYYAGHDQSAIMRYAFWPEDVVKGNLEDAQAEISVKVAELLDFEVLRENPSAIRSVKIKKGTLLYHGTSAEEAFEEDGGTPDGPAWFTESPEVARFFQTWHGGPEYGRPRILVYRVVESIPDIAKIPDGQAFQVFLRQLERMGALEEGDGAPEELAEAMSSSSQRKWEGWRIIGNYSRPDGDDILLVSPERYLEFVGLLDEAPRENGADVLVVVHPSSIEAYIDTLRDMGADPVYGEELLSNIALTVREHKGPVIWVDQGWSGRYIGRLRAEVADVPMQKILFDEDTTPWARLWPKLRKALRSVGAASAQVAGLWWGEDSGCARAVFEWLEHEGMPVVLVEDAVGYEDLRGVDIEEDDEP